jgi:serine/threonine protein kinase
MGTLPNARSDGEDRVPSKLGKYEVLAVIGHGAFGRVYRGRDPFTGRVVAIKVARASPSDEAGRLSQRLFFNEARLAGLLDHPNILSVYDAGEEGQVPYIVMEYVEGSRTLKEHCRPGELLPVERTIEIVFRCARALDYAHRLGVVHRDIKSANILLTAAGEVKIADFGIARRLESDTTQMIGMVGSPPYMSPEQVREEPVTGQSDVYSLGVVFFELLTGRLPFHGTNLPALLYAVLHDPPPRPRSLRVDLPESLEAVVLKALSRDRSTRHPTAGDLALDLSKVYEHLGQVATEVDETERFTQARALAFFREFSDGELWEVVRAASWEQHTSGDRIVLEGALEERLYVIASGDVMVRKDARAVGTLGAGDCFGEMGYLDNARRTTTIVAIKEVTALSIDSATVGQLSPATQIRFLRAFVRTLVHRLARAGERRTGD